MQGSLEELEFQYKAAATLWLVFSSELNVALFNLFNRERLRNFRAGPWRRLASLHQQAGLYWEVAEDAFQQMEAIGKQAEALNRLRQRAAELDEMASIAIKTFTRVCDHLDEQPALSRLQIKEICERRGERSLK